MRHLSIRLFAGLFALSMILSAVLIHRLSGRVAFAVALPPNELVLLAARLQMVRIAGLVFAAILALSVVTLASRAARGALALRWLLGALTSIAFLRAAGLVGPLIAQDTWLVVLSAVQLAIEALAILLLYSPDAQPWFFPQRWRTRERR